MTARKTAAAKPIEDTNLPDVAPPDPVRIDTAQMRHLHALLRDHGISGDKSVHDYLTAAGYPVESRADLTKVAAAKLIAELETATVHQAAGPARLSALRAPFPAEALGKLPRSTCRNCSDNRGTCDEHQRKIRCQECGNWHSTATMHIDYVGHADVTARLLAVDPEWSWRHFTQEEVMALPPDLRSAGLWIHLTVLGVTRPGFGDADGKRGGNAVKEAIGDALRNAAMRFGVALDLWAKGDREWAHAEKHGTDQHPDQAPPRQEEPPQAPPTPPAGPPPYYGPTTAELLLAIDAHAARAGVTYEKITEKWRAANGGLSVDDLDNQPPQKIAELENSIATYLAANPPPTPAP